MDLPLTQATVTQLMKLTLGDGHETGHIIDVFAHAEPAYRRQLAQAVIDLLKDYTDLKGNADEIAALCYLSASIGATQAIPTLIQIVEESKYDGLVAWTGESVRSRALRALVGLLSVEPVRTPELRELLMGLLWGTCKAYRHLALTALAGLWPEERAEFARQVPEVSEERLRLSLELAGFEPGMGVM